MPEEAGIYPYHRLKTKRFKRRQAHRTVAIPVGLTLFYVGAAFLFGRAAILNELHPFGPAFYAALLVTRLEMGLPAGLAVGAGLATVVRGPELLAGLVGLLFVRLAMGRLVHRGKGVARAAVAALVAASILTTRGVVLAMGQGGLDQSLALVCEALLAAVLSMAFPVVLGSRTRPEMGAPIGEEVACWLVFLLGMLGGLAGTNLAGLSLQDIGANLLVLLASLSAGAGGGTVAGVAVGLVPTLTALEPPWWIALYAVSGLLGGLLASFRRPGVVLGYFVGILLLSVYFFNRAAIVNNLEVALVAAFVFFLLPNTILRHIDWFPLAGERAEEYWQHRLDRAEQKIREQLRQLAAVFKDLGESFRQARNSNGTDAVVAPNWNELAPKICASCPAREVCWEKEGQAVLHPLQGILPVLQEKGRIETGDLPRQVRNSCFRPRELVAGVNRVWEDYHRFRLWQDQLEQTRDLVSGHLLQVAELMGELEQRITLQNQGNQGLVLRLGEALRREGIQPEDLEALAQRDGRVEVRLQMAKCETRAFCRQLLAPVVGRVVGQQLTVDDSRCPWAAGGRQCRVRFLPAGILKLQTGLAQAAKDGCAFCGDTWAAMALPGGYYFLGLSDGMGSGHKAAQESEAALSLAKRLLILGFTPEMTVTTVNSLLLRPGQQERYATMDLVFINLYSGEAQLVKVGAAPSFIKRGRQVMFLNGGSPPAGILQELALSVSTKRVEPGDLLLLVTDGVLVRGEEWLLQALGELESTQPQAVADLLLHQAIALAGNCLRDDMSILAARVERVG